MKMMNGLLFEVRGEELAQSFTKMANHHAERAAHFETRRSEWEALPQPVLARRTEAPIESARGKLMAELEGEGPGRLHKALEAMGEGPGQEFDGARAFTRKVDFHRSENARLTFLANHVPKDATYTLTYGEMQSAGLVHEEGPSPGYEKSDRRR